MGCTQSRSQSTAVVQHKQVLQEQRGTVEKKKNVEKKKENVPEKKKKKNEDFRTDYAVAEEVGEGSISKTYIVTKIHEDPVVVKNVDLDCASIYTMKPQQDDPTESESEIDSVSPAAKKQYAAEELSTTSIEPSALDEMRKEIDVIKAIHHPNVVKLHQVYEDEDKGHMSLVTDLCSGGDLYSQAPYSERQARKIVQSICLAVHYLHKRGIVYLDLRFETIMFEDNTRRAQVRLVDFGFAQKYVKGDSEKLETVYTKSPEAIHGEYSQQADVWSIGVIAYQLLSSDKPFWEEDCQEMTDKIVKADYNFDASIWEEISNEAKEFVNNCLQVEPELRFTTEAALNSSWLKPVPKKTNDQSLSPAGKSLLNSPKGDGREFRKLAMNSIARKTTSQEIVNLRKIFHEIDDDNDGTITVEQLKKGLESHFEEEDINSWFQHFNVDETKGIIYTEFLAALLDAQGDVQLERIAEAFRLFDRDGKGYITPGNLRAVLGVCEDSDYIEKLIKETDSDHDGKISFREFKDAIIKNQNDKKAALVADDTKPLIAEIE